MSVRTVGVVVLCGALAACECGKVGVPGQQPDMPAEADAGLFVPEVDAGQPVLQGVFATATGDLALVRLDGGSVVLVNRATLGEISDLRSPRWQPNGTTLAFADGDTAWTLTGGLATHLSHDDMSAYQGNTTTVEWSPSGARLALGGRDRASNESVFLVPEDAGFPELLARADRWAWAADGRAVLSSYFDGDRQVHVLQRTELSTRLTTPILEARLLAVSPSGLLFTQRETVTDAGVDRAIEVHSPDGGVRQLFASGGPVLTDDAFDALLVSADDELVVRGVADLGGTPKFQVLRGTSTGGFVALFDLASSDPEYPWCLRFGPGGLLSWQTGQSPADHFVSWRDGGVQHLMLPDLELGQPRTVGCVDWRVVRE